MQQELLELTPRARAHFRLGTEALKYVALWKMTAIAVLNI